MTKVNKSRALKAVTPSLTELIAQHKQIAQKYEAIAEGKDETLFKKMIKLEEQIAVCPVNSLREYAAKARFVFSAIEMGNSEQVYTDNDEFNNQQFAFFELVKDAERLAAQAVPAPKAANHLDALINRLAAVHRYYSNGSLEEEEYHTMDAEIEGLKTAILNTAAQTLDQAAVQVALCSGTPSLLEYRLRDLFWYGKEIDKRETLEDIAELGRVLYSVGNMLVNKLPPEVFKEYLTDIETGKPKSSPFPKVA